MASKIKFNELQTGALNIITAVKYDVDLINAVNRMTFLFDPNWQGIGNTLPISFFYVKEFKELMESEVSQKTLLFYNSQNSNNPDAVSGGLLGVVSDNIINKPKKYQMSIVIPSNLDVYMRQYMFSNRVSFADLYKSSNTVMNGVLEGVDIVANSYMFFLDTLLKVLGATSISLKDTSSFELNVKDWISEKLTGLSDDSNKASLDAMWENRTILRMKYWNGWRFKYVVIESYAPSKVGEEDNFYEATLNVTELPIMSLRKDGSSKVPKGSLLATTLLSGKNKLTTKAINEFLDRLESKGQI